MSVARNGPFDRFCLVIVVALLLAACGGAESVDTTAAVPTTEAPTATEATTTTSQPTTTTTTPPAVGAHLPETPVVAMLGQGQGNVYKVDLSTSSAVPVDESELPVPPGTIEIRWYTVGDVYAVVYVGIDLSTTEPLCPGNSILSSESGLFEDVSNAPTVEGACEGFSTLTTDPDVGPRECGNSMVYVTAIPSSKPGTLFGTLEQLADGGDAIVGLTSQAMTRDDIAELDIDAVCGS